MPNSEIKMTKKTRRHHDRPFMKQNKKQENIGENIEGDGNRRYKSVYHIEICTRIKILDSFAAQVLKNTYREATNFRRRPLWYFIWISIECFQMEQITALKCKSFRTRNGLAFWEKYTICFFTNWTFVRGKSNRKRNRILDLNK